MKHLMKHIAMVAVVVAVAVGGYMAYQHCYGKKEQVKIQFFDVNRDEKGSNKSYDSGYNAGYKDGLRDANK